VLDKTSAPSYQPGKDTRPLSPTDLSDAEVKNISDIERRLIEVRDVRRPAARDKSGGDYLARAHDRHRRVLLLDGGRGTGKTSVLVTLVRRWNPPACEDYDLTLGPRPDFVRVLPILDFDPLPPGMPLAAWIIQAWRPLVNHYDEIGRNAITSADQDDSLLDRWHRLFRVAAVGWSSIPRETGLIEQVLDREEQVGDWHHLNQQWYDFVDSVIDFETEHLPKQARSLPSRPVFVIMIDDVDLQVSRAPELLPALRLLYHPSVVFLVAADRGHLVDMLQLDFLGRQNDLARHTTAGQRLLWDVAERDRWCASLANSSFEKVFSRRDLWRLKKLSLSEFLHFPGPPHVFRGILNARGGPISDSNSFDPHRGELLGDYLLSFASVVEKLTEQSTGIITYRAAQQLADEVFMEERDGAGATALLLRLLDPQDGEQLAVELRKSGTPSMVQYRPVGEVAALFSPDLVEDVDVGRQDIFLSGSPRFKFIPEPESRWPRPATGDSDFPLAELLAISLQDSGRKVIAPGLKWEAHLSLAWTLWRTREAPDAAFRWLLHVLPPPLVLLEWAARWAKFIGSLAAEAVHKKDRIAYGWIYHQFLWLGLDVSDVDDPVKADLDDEDTWARLLEKNPKDDDTSTSPRYFVPSSTLGPDRWRRRTLPLLARPEIGLTEKVQKRLLLVRADHQSSDDLIDERKRLVRDAFDAAALQSGTRTETVGREEAAVAAVLSAVDLQYPNSPWQKFISELRVSEGLQPLGPVTGQ